MSSISKEEFNNLVSGEKSDTDILSDRKEAKEEEVKENQSTYDILLGRSKKTVFVYFDGCSIEIKAHIGNKAFRSLGYLKLWSQVMFGIKEPSILDDNKSIDLFAEFLEFITIDEELNKEFWINPELDYEIGQKIFTEYLNQKALEVERVKKFRSQ